VIDPIAVPTIDGGRLNQDQRVSPLPPQPSQDQPQQTVRPPKAPIRTREDGDLVVQGKHLEQQVSTSRQRQSDRRDGRHDVTHRAHHGHLPMPASMILPGCDIGEGQAH
jgi:hypothetical protein